VNTRISKDIDWSIGGKRTKVHQSERSLGLRRQVRKETRVGVEVWLIRRTLIEEAETQIGVEGHTLVFFLVLSAVGAVLFIAESFHRPSEMWSEVQMPILVLGRHT